jgi:putative hydrolase of the HAD superfamily
MSLELITIDFWNTLFDASNGNDRNAYRVSEMKNEIARLGITIDDAKYQSVMEESWEYFNDIWKNQLRTPTAAESIDFFSEKLNLPKNSDTVERILKVFAESILYFPPKLIDGVKDALDELSHNYRLAIVSDTGFSPGSVLKRLMYENGVLHYFSAFSFSDETKVAKPHKKAFVSVLEDLNVKPDAALHVGDIEDTDIKGAKAVGMMAVRFTGDPTAFLNLNKSNETVADFMSDSWQEIVEFIKSVN